MKKLFLSILFLLSLTTLKSQCAYYTGDYLNCTWGVEWFPFPEEYWIVLMKDTSWIKFDTDTFKLQDRYITPLDIDHFKESYSWGPTPSGQVTMFAGSSAPTGYLICDGSAVSRTTYSALFTAIGTTFGVGDGSTTFNLPDLRQRFPLGKSASGTGSTLGGTGGTIDPVYSADPPSTITTGPSATAQATALGPAVGSGTHTHNVDISAFNVTGVNPPYLVINYIIKY